DRGAQNAMFAEFGLAQLSLAQGNVEEASAACDRLRGLIEQNPDPFGVADAWTGLRGAVAWRRGDPIDGERLLQEAIEGLRAKNLGLDTIPFLYELRDLYQ